MVTCELCGKEVKTTQGLRGHKTFQHGVTGNSTQQSVARVATEQQVSLLEERLSKLEYITGLGESDWNDPVSNTQPFTDRLSNINEQLSKLSDTVSKLSEDVGLAKADKVMVGELNQKLKEAHDRLGAVMNNHLDIFNKNFEVHQSRIDKAQKMVEDLGEGLGMVKTRLATHGHDGLKVVPEMVAKVANFQQTLEKMQSQIDYLGRVVKRQPTGDVVELTCTDDKKHTFREYKSTEGLKKPHQTSSDFIFGSRWIDLAEPED